MIQARRQNNGGPFEGTLVLVLIDIILDRQILANVQCCITGVALLLKLVTI